MTALPDLWVLVDHPGYWAHGRIFTAEKVTLQLRLSGATSHSIMKGWEGEMETVNDVRLMKVRCYMIEDIEWGPFAVPATKCREVEPPRRR